MPGRLAAYRAFGLSHGRFSIALLTGAQHTVRTSISLPTRREAYYYLYCHILATYTT